MTTPPQATEVEEGVLGALLLMPDESDVVFDLLTKDDFYTPLNKTIFTKAFKLHSQGKPIDPILMEKGLGVDCSHLTSVAYSSANIEHYCQIIREKAIRRRMIKGSNDLQERAYDSSTDTYDLIDDLNKMADTIDTGSKTVHSLTPSQIFDREAKNPIQETILTGDRKLDDGLFSGSGMKRGHVNLIIGESGHGKSSFARYVAECVLRRGYKVHWIQLEDYDVNTARHFEKNCPEQMDNIAIAQDLYDIEDIKRECRIVKRDRGTDLIFFDYVQNIACDKKERAGQVEYISQQITRMAKDLNVVCVPLSQVSINQGSRHGWNLEPNANDVRWSKQLKQDAHAITSVFKPSEIESLLDTDESVKDWNEKLHPVSSAWIKQCKTRYGVKEFRRYHMIHTDKGLKPYTEVPF